jgi:molecular chaperone DnaK (HSP70)
MGHSKTTFILSEFRPTHFYVVDCFTDPFFGGRDFDIAIFGHLAEVFYNKNKIDLRKEKKSCLRLLEQITKARKTLTANSEVMISVDSIYDDLDFSYLLKRAEFESICGGLFNKFASHLDNFYKTCLKMIDKNINSVEMAGEFMRTPALNAIIKNVTGKELSKSIIVDECISKGCALYAASLENRLPITGFMGTYHNNPYSIAYAINDITHKLLLIKRGELIPSRKSLELRVNELQSNEVSLFFFYSPEETQYIIPAKEFLLVEFVLDINNLMKKNNLKNIENILLVDVEIDNTARLKMLNIKVPQKGGKEFTNLAVSSDIIYMNRREIYKKSNEVSEFIQHFKKVETDQFQADETYKHFHIKKNQLESEVYKLKNKYVGDEYANLSADPSGGDGRSIIERLNSIEQGLYNNEAAENMRMSFLDTTKQKLNDIEKKLNASVEGGANDTKVVGSFINKLDLYSNMIDNEYVKVLQGGQSKYNEKTIELIGDIISKYRQAAIHAKDDNEMRKYEDQFDNEIKKYFK